MINYYEETLRGVAGLGGVTAITTSVCSVVAIVIVCRETGETKMSEQIEDEKRVWYLKGYEQAERDCEALIKKLVKDISDLSAERLALIDGMDLFGTNQTENLKLHTRLDLLTDLLTDAYGVIDSDYDGTEEHARLRRAIRAELDMVEEE
jgi:hypothetical protein